MNRPTLAAAAGVVLAATAAATLHGTAVVDGHGAVGGSRAVTFDGADLRYHAAAWRGDCGPVNFDVRYVDGREPFLSTLTLCDPAHFIPNPVDGAACATAAWTVYRGPRAARPAAAIAHGVTSCHGSSGADR